MSDNEEQSSSKMLQMESLDDELEMLAIIRLQIKSEVSGVIDGDCTIPYPVSVKSSWTEVFKILNIKFDPKKHQLKGHGIFVEDLSSRILAYCKHYKTNRSTYHAIIVARSKPKKEKLKRTRRKKCQIFNVSSATKTDTRRNKSNITQQTRQTRSQNRQSHETPLNGNIRQKTTHASQDNAASNKFFNKTPQVKSVTSTISSQMSFGKQVDLVYRDETTQEGDNVGPNECQLKPKILKYIQSHCSNRDMLLIRNELTGLKLALKFQALNRLVPFTAGFLQNTFVDANEDD